MRLIDADELFKDFEKSAWFNNADRDDVAEELLLNAPTIDAEPVVRCKDCKYLCVVNRNDMYAVCKKVGTFFKPFGFLDTREHSCACGERKENNDEID